MMLAACIVCEINFRERSAAVTGLIILWVEQQMKSVWVTEQACICVKKDVWNEVILCLGCYLSCFYPPFHFLIRHTFSPH